MLLKKSQLGTIDLFIAMSIFLVVLGIVIFSWNQYAGEFRERAGYKDTQIKALQVSELFVKTPGSPSAWEKLSSAANIETLGLAKDSNVISRSKVAKILDSSFLTDVRIKEILNIEVYNFSFSITEENGSDKYEGGKLIKRGSSPIANKTIVSLRRPILYESEEDRAMLEFTLWEK